MYFPNSVSLEGSHGGKKELSPLSESTGGDRRIHRSQVPIWQLPAPGSFSRRAVFPDPGPWICDTDHIFDTFWTLNRNPGHRIWRQFHTFHTFRILGWDPGRWIRRQLYTFDTFSELNRIGSHRICDTGHIFYIICIHNLDPGLRPWALDLASVIHFSHIGLWICHTYSSFHTFGSDRIGSTSDRIQ